MADKPVQRDFSDQKPNLQWNARVMVDNMMPNACAREKT